MRKLKAVPKDRIWGTDQTAPWFANPEKERIGEVWFDVPQSCPLLIKFLFTSADLSVQVHPRDCEGARGKTEMWHVLRAEPGARVALGLNREVTADELKAACLSGAVDTLLNWAPAHVGDTFFVPAGTVHALGRGLVVCEIQQNSDCTFRMYDYGRDRELHLDAGLAVSDLKPYNGQTSMPVSCDYFEAAFDDFPDRERFVIALDGSCAGECWQVDAEEPASELLDTAARPLFVTAR